jgi:hypothetical protein
LVHDSPDNPRNHPLAATADVDMVIPVVEVESVNEVVEVVVATDAVVAVDIMVEEDVVVVLVVLVVVISWQTRSDVAEGA